MSKKRAAVWLAGVLLVGLYYMLEFRYNIVLAYQDAAPAWFVSVINLFYPRFAVEKNRFDIAFFLSKADQVMLRFILVNVLLLFYLFYRKYSYAFAQAIRNFWGKSVPIRQVNWISALFYLSMIVLSYGYYHYLDALAKVAVFYKPLLVLQVLHIPFPTSGVIIGLYILLLASCLGIIVRLQPVLNSVVALMLFLLFQAWLFSFEKIDHTFATFNYAAMVMPFLLYERERAFKQQLTAQEGWPLQLICLCIGLVYLMSGVEKILISGIGWISADSFRSYIFLHQAPLGIWIAKSEWLSRLLPAMALLFQLGFISVVFYPKLRVLFLITGIAFHAGTYLLFGVGWYVGPWVFVYLFFINWDRFSGLLPLKLLSYQTQTKKTLF